MEAKEVVEEHTQHFLDHGLAGPATPGHLPTALAPDGHLPTAMGRDRHRALQSALAPWWKRP